MHLTGMNHKEAGGRRRQATAAIVEIAGAGLNQTELIFFVPVARHRAGSAKAAPEFKTGEVVRSPDLYEIASLIRFHVLIANRRCHQVNAIMRPRGVAMDESTDK